LLSWLLGSVFISLFTGSVYVVASLGLTLTLAVVKLPNFAHAEFLTIGAYAGAVVSFLFPGNFALMSTAAFLLCAFIALIINTVVYSKLISKRVTIYILVLASFAVAQFVRYGVFVIASLTGLLSTAPDFPLTVIANVYTAQLTNAYLIALVLSIGVSVILALFLNYTGTGRSMRAISDNSDLARVSGVKYTRVVNLMWIIAGGLGGVGGVILSTYTTVTPVMGFNLLLEIFAVVIIAGLTSFIGTIVGGYLVGFVEGTVMAVLNHYFGLAYTYQPLLPFALIIIMLLFKPTGLAPNVALGAKLAKKLAGRKK
jgi:branched-subunit amino acid ABC-type transport system permease component